MRVMHCLDMLAKTKNIPGDVIELGVSQGTTTFPMSATLWEMDKTKVIYACDTYQGLPYDETIKNGSEMKKGECNGGNKFKQVYSTLKTPNIIMIEGLVEETLPKQLSDKKFSFVWCDMDLYLPTSFAYKFLEDRVSIGGIFGFHDYKFVRCPGIEKVIDNELDKKKYERMIFVNNCIFFKKVR